MSLTGAIYFTCSEVMHLKNLFENWANRKCQYFSHFCQLPYFLITLLAMYLKSDICQIFIVFSSHFLIFSCSGGGTPLWRCPTMSLTTTTKSQLKYVISRWTWMKKVSLKVDIDDDGDEKRIWQWSFNDNHCNQSGVSTNQTRGGGAQADIDDDVFTANLI